MVGWVLDFFVVFNYTFWFWIFPVGRREWNLWLWCSY